MDETFQKPKHPVTSKLKASPLTDNYSQVNTAFRYLMRFKLSKINQNMIEGSWVAEFALQIAELQGLTNYHKKAGEIIKEAKNNLLIYKKMDNNSIEKPLIESAMYLSMIDSFFTEGTEDIVLVDNNDLKDLKQLISIVDTEIFRSKNLCIWNPSFGEGSRLVGGAEADLILDNMIIEIKTDKNIQLKDEDLDLLWGYYTLFNLSRPKGMKKEDKIKKVGIYFARHSYLYKIDVNECINKEKFPEFLEYFEQRANDEFM